MSILPNFVFLLFPIFAVKLEYLQLKEKNVLNMNWPSLTAKKHLQRKKFGRVGSWSIPLAQCKDAAIEVYLFG